MNAYRISVVLCLLLALPGFGCGTPEKPDPTRRMVPVDSVAEGVAVDTITVRQFRFVCDALARDLVSQPFVARSERPPVITIRKIENKTNVDIDETIYQETIRAKLMENSGGSVLFRDDESYRDIIQERVRQGSDEVTVVMTDSVVETRTRDRIDEQEFERGALSGSTGTGEETRNLDEERDMQMSQTSTVEAKIAAADYFLRGIIYQVNEPLVNTPERGTAYFQYQFRVVDARTGLIVWEKSLRNKSAGLYAAGDPTADPNDPTGGQTPPGWPTGTQAPPGQSGPSINQVISDTIKNVKEIQQLQQQMRDKDKNLN